MKARFGRVPIKKYIAMRFNFIAFGTDRTVNALVVLAYAFLTTRHFRPGLIRFISKSGGLWVGITQWQAWPSHSWGVTRGVLGRHNQDHLVGRSGGETGPRKTTKQVHRRGLLTWRELERRSARSPQILSSQSLARRHAPSAMSLTEFPRVIR